MRRLALLAGLVAAMLAAAAARQTGAAPAAKAPSALFLEIRDDYMGGKWDALETLFKEKAREIGTLEKAEAADVMLMRQAMAEGRPAWWAAVKQKKKVDIKVSLWGRSMNATFDPELQGSTNKAANGAITVNWLIADMDNPANAEHGFSKADLGAFNAFSVLGTAETWAILPPLSMQLDDAGKAALLTYFEFRGHLTGLEYGNPRVRQWGLFLEFLSYRKEYEKLTTRMARKAIAAFVIGEILSHRDVYASVELPATLEAVEAEETLALELANWFEKHQLTFSEDNALRAAIKPFATANLAKPHTTGKVELPNKLLVGLDETVDKALKAKRDAWVKAAFDKAKKAEKK